MLADRCGNGQEMRRLAPLIPSLVAFVSFGCSPNSVFTGISNINVVSGDGYYHDCAGDRKYADMLFSVSREIENKASDLRILNHWPPHKAVNVCLVEADAIGCPGLTQKVLGCASPWHQSDSIWIWAATRTWLEGLISHELIMALMLDDAIALPSAALLEGTDIQSLPGLEQVAISDPNYQMLLDAGRQGYHMWYVDTGL